MDANKIEYIVFSNEIISLDTSITNQIGTLLYKYNLNHKKEFNECIYNNDYLVIHIKNNGFIILSLLVPPGKTEKGIVILDDIFLKIGRIILSNSCNISKEISVLDQGSIALDGFTEKTFSSQKIDSLTFQTARGLRITINNYVGKYIISFFNCKNIVDILKRASI
jgi:hypothetical protein